MKIRPNPPKVAWLVTGFAFFLLYVPLVCMVIYSFLVPEMNEGIPTGGGTHFGFHWYNKVFSNYEVLDALRMSFWVALWSTAGATLLGTGAALALERTRFPARKVFNALVHVPLVMPEIVLGLSLLIWFVLLRLTLGSVSIILAHITFCVSYVIITVKSRLQDFDESYEEAAKDLGASPWAVFWKVTFPLIRPGIASGALMAFTLSFDDFLVTFFTAGVGTDTLPLKIYSMIKFGVSPEINALSTLILAVTLGSVLIFFGPLQKSELS